MKIKGIAKNQTELTLNNTIVLFSYETPVACIEDNVGYKTITKYSSTTTRHINAFFVRHCITDVKTVPQQEIDNIIK